MRPRPTTLTKGGVLLLGGDADLQQTVRAALQAESYEVLPATNRDEAKELLDAGLIDIIVMYVDSRPETVAPWLAELNARRHHLRIIGIREPGQRAAGSGWASANLWMEEPLDVSGLIAAVNNHLEALRAENFREALLRRRDAPLYGSVSYDRWGLNE